MQAGIALDVTPTPLPADVPAWIRLSGLEAGAEVTLHAEFRDASTNRWGSEATFLADGHGAVDLAQQAPVRGSYDRVDPMGLISSAAMVADQSGLPFFPVSLTPEPLSISATVADQLVARVDVPWSLLTTDIRSYPVDAPGVVAWLYRPSGSEPRPAIIVLGGSEGGLNPYTEREAALFATHGYAALAMAYFGIGELPPALANIPLEYFQTVIRWLQARPDIDGERIGVVGTSRGGELALLLGATYPEIKAVVSYVGSGLVVSALDGVTPAWTRGGEPIPSYDFVSDASAALATIPVERIDGPVLLISGGQDLLWPSDELSQAAMDRLVAHQHPYPHEHLTYPEAGHYIQTPYLPITAATVAYLGGTAAASAAACADSWPRVLHILSDRLKP